MLEGEEAEAEAAVSSVLVERSGLSDGHEAFHGQVFEVESRIPT